MWIFRVVMRFNTKISTKTLSNAQEVVSFSFFLSFSYFLNEQENIGTQQTLAGTKNTVMASVFNHFGAPQVFFNSPCTLFLWSFYWYWFQLFRMIKMQFKKEFNIFLLNIWLIGLFLLLIIYDWWTFTDDPPFSLQALLRITWRRWSPF